MPFIHCQLLAMKLARTKKTPRLSIVIICPTQSALYKIYHQSQLFLVLFIEVFGVGSSYLINISPQYLSKYDAREIGNKYLDEIFIFMMIAE